jgi:hypothetical protein
MVSPKNWLCLGFWNFGQIHRLTPTDAHKSAAHANPQRMLVGLEPLWFTTAPVRYKQKGRFKNRPFCLLVQFLDLNEGRGREGQIAPPV